MASQEKESSGGVCASPIGTDIADLHDRLAAAYGPQRWWPTQDPSNPRFEILIGAVLTQHTAWTNVEIAIEMLRAAGPLSAETILTHADLPTLIRRAGPHRIKAERLRALCRWFLDRGGFARIDSLDTPTLCHELRGVRGIGPETADVIALYAFGRPRFVADGYAFRIMERYGWWQGTRRYEQLREMIEVAAGQLGDARFYNELHALIVAHAKRCCHKHAPACAGCVLGASCAQAGQKASANRGC